MVPMDSDTTIVKSVDFAATFFQDFKHLMCTKKKTRFSKNDFTIAKIFLSFVRFLQIFGLVPVSVQKRGYEIQYNHKILSFNSFYCWLTAVAVAFTFVVVILNRELNIPWPLKIFKSASDIPALFDASDTQPTSGLLVMNRAFRIIIPMASLLLSTSARIMYHVLPTFFNNWTYFSKEFSSTFSTSYKWDLRDLEAIKNRLFNVCLLITSIGFVIGTKKSFMILVNDDPIVNFFALFFGWVYFGSAWFFNSALNAQSLYTVRVMLRELRHGIDAQYEAVTRGVTYDEVKSWVRLVSLIRNQVLEYQKFAGFPELSDLLSTFVMILCLLLFIINMVLNGANPNETKVIPFVLSVVSFSILRLYVKAYQAEKIEEEEQKIAIRVISMKTNDCKTRLEMKILVDLITTNPIKITYGGSIVVLNRGLVLSLLSQLAAYLVVLIQLIEATAPG